jgi:hypothetical protein
MPKKKFPAPLNCPNAACGKPIDEVTVVVIRSHTAERVGPKLYEYSECGDGDADREWRCPHCDEVLPDDLDIEVDDTGE